MGREMGLIFTTAPHSENALGVILLAITRLKYIALFGTKCLQ
jgi:hypothetical protein